MAKTTAIYCCGCEKLVNAELTNGEHTYPHRKDLHNLPFWICNTCLNFVGCHHKTKYPTKPLGVRPNKELKKYRMYIHKILDPLWKSGKIPRKDLYKEISSKLGGEYHTASLKTIDEAKRVYKLVKKIRERLN